MSRLCARHVPVSRRSRNVVTPDHSRRGHMGRRLDTCSSSRRRCSSRRRIQAGGSRRMGLTRAQRRDGDAATSARLSAAPRLRLAVICPGKRAAVAVRVESKRDVCTLRCSSPVWSPMRSSSFRPPSTSSSACSRRSSASLPSATGLRVVHLGACAHDRAAVISITVWESRASADAATAVASECSRNNLTDLATIRDEFVGDIVVLP